jgi:hypothetical protein
MDVPTDQAMVECPEARASQTLCQGLVDSHVKDEKGLCRQAATVTQVTARREAVHPLHLHNMLAATASRLVSVT